MADVLENIGERTIENLDYVGSLNIQWWATLRAMGQSLPFVGNRYRWQATVRQMLEIGVTAMPMVSLMAICTGFIFAMQGASELRRFGALRYVIDLVAVGFTRELGPLPTAIAVSGRSGSAFAAEIGTMKVTEELDSLRVMALEPVEFVLAPKYLAALIAVPCLSIISNFFGIFAGGLFMFFSTRLTPALYLHYVFAAIDLRDVVMGLIKSGVCNVVIGRGNVVGAELVRNPDVAKISFTGSVAVGQSIMRDGAATMKRITLELGGKSPTILLDDAALERAIPSALVLAFMNSGQACAAGTRLLVPKSRLDAVKQAIVDAMRSLPVGDPADPKTAVGPMVSQNQYERVQSYIRKGIEEGAEVLVGGEGHPAGFEAGYFVKPTVFVNVKNDMTIAQEEIFGPVLDVITYDSEDEAIRIANDSKYGLHSCVLGTDLQRARRVASQIRAGRVVINGMTDDPQAPWGGF